MDLPSSFILRKPFSSIAIGKKVKFDEARCLFRHFCVSKVITAAHAHKRGVVFHIFEDLSNKKKFKKLRPKMSKIASRGGPAIFKQALGALLDINNRYAFLQTCKMKRRVCTIDGAETQ